MEEQVKKTSKFSERLEAFFDRNYALIFAPIFVLALYFVGLAIYGVYPFGNKYTAASYDLSAQICPFIEHLFDVMQGKSTLTYSYAIVGGADVTGTFLYFFISPFSFLFLIFGDGKVAHASSIVMVCKLMTISFAGAWFAKKQFKNIPDYICLVIGVTYAYCGYMFVANTYINWMDFLIYMPFCVAAFRRFVTTGKFFLFSVTVACCIYTCFSIACFSLFTVFPALIVYGILCVEKERRNKFIAYLVVSFAVAILLALPVLVPALVAFMNSARGGNLFENLWYGYKLSSETSAPTDFDSSAFLDKYSESLYRKWSYIVADSIFFVLTVLWFIRTGLKNKFAQFMLAAGVMTLLPLVVDEAMNLMNMGSYMSYALRFGFLNAIYFLGGACLAIDGVCYDKACAFDGSRLFGKLTEETPACQELSVEEKKGNEGGMVALNEEMPSQELLTFPAKKSKAAHYVCVAVLTVLTLISVAILVLFSMGGGYKTFWGFFIKDTETLNSMNGFSGRFAHSLGGLEVVIVPFVLVALLVTVGSIMVANRKITPRFLSFALVLVVGMQVVFYNNHLVSGNASTQHVGIGHYQNISAVLNEREDGYFRVKDYNDKWTACVPFSGNSNSFSVFSSVIDADNFTTFQLFGYLGNGKNSFKSGHSSTKYNRSDEFGDSMMGYKYFLVYGDPKKKGKTVEEQLTELENNKPYLRKVTEIDEKGNEVHLKRGDYYVYENTIVFPLGYRVQNADFEFVCDNISDPTNRKKNQAALYEYLRGENLKTFTGSDVVKVKSATELSEYLWGKAAEVEVSAGQIKAKVTAQANERLLLNFVASKGYKVTVNGKERALAKNDLDFLSVELDEGYNEVVFTYSSPYVKYALVGIGGGLAALAAVWFVVTKTKLVDACAGVIAWAGVLVAMGVVAFFMLYPTCVFVVKLFAWLL